MFPIPPCPSPPLPNPTAQPPPTPIQAHLKRNVRAARYPTNEAPAWKQLSVDGRSLVGGLLTAAPHTRLAAWEALSHRWLKQRFRASSTSQVSSTDSLDVAQQAALAESRQLRPILIVGAVPVPGRAPTGPPYPTTIPIPTPTPTLIHPIPPHSHPYHPYHTPPLPTLSSSVSDAPETSCLAADERDQAIAAQHT